MKRNQIGIFLLLIIIASSCSPISKQNEFVAITPIEAYNKIIENLDTLHPGKGEDVFNKKHQNRPMAYGLIMSAESNRYKYLKDSSIIHRVRLCGEWLLENSDINNNGIYGYGIADSWDAFSDGSINPKHQEYTITTAFAIKGLLDWHSIEADSLKRTQIETVVYNCITPFLTDTYDSPIGIPAYTFNSNDKQYDDFNAAVYLGGQLYRYSTIVENDSIRQLLSSKSNKIVEVMADNQLLDDSNNIYWYYALQIKKPNDLLHVSYIIEGLRDYKHFGGSLNMNWDAILNTLNVFNYNNKWYEFNEQIGQDDDNVRLWALGITMYSLAMNCEYSKIEETLWPQINEYYTANGTFMFRLSDDRSMIRQDAHLLLGLSYYLYNDKSMQK